MPGLPPWLDVHPGDLAADYARGVQIGQGIGAERARLSQEAQRAQMEAQARQENLAREAATEQQRIAMQKAYQQAQIGIRAQDLRQKEEWNRARTAAAAQKFAQTQMFNKLVADGMNPTEAAFKAGVGTPALAIQESRSKDAALVHDAQMRRQAYLEQQAAAKQTGQHKIGTMDIPLPVPPGQAYSGNAVMKNVQLNDPVINKVMGTNAPPGTGTNYVAAPLSGQVAPAPVAAAAPAAPSPLPKTKDKLQKGASYLTQHGVYTWNGQQLVKQSDDTAQANSDAGGGD